MKLSASPTQVPNVTGLSALNINPEQAAHDYRERVVGPYRAVLPAVAIASMEEQLSGACTVEIAAFDEFSKLLGDKAATASFDHVIFDTAPTGHTLRLLELPAAWSNFIDTNVGGTSCLGPLSGLNAQKALYAASNEALRDPAQTILVLVARPERSSLAEAERTRAELAQLGVGNVRLDLERGVPRAGCERSHRGRDGGSGARVARCAACGASRAVAGRRSAAPVRACRNRRTSQDGSAHGKHRSVGASGRSQHIRGERLDDLVDELAKRGKGVVMTMGKGGVGKTTVAARIAIALARRGLPVTLTTTDPAAHVEQAVRELSAGATGLRVTRIDPALETRRYTEEVLKTAGNGLDAQGKALLEEDLRSPCTEEIAVFRAFAETVAQGADRFVIIDTAPTGHTLLLLDAAESYHREVLKKPSGSPEAVQQLLPRLRDPEFTHVLLVTLPESHADPRSDAARARPGARGHQAVCVGGEPKPHPARGDGSGAALPACPGGNTLEGAGRPRGAHRARAVERRVLAAGRAKAGGPRRRASAAGDVRCPPPRGGSVALYAKRRRRPWLTLQRDEGRNPPRSTAIVSTAVRCDRFQVAEVDVEGPPERVAASRLSDRRGDLAQPDRR